MKSTLPLTGKCHLCGEPTSNRFCCKEHCDTYNMRKYLGITKPWAPHQKSAKQPEPQAPTECPHGRGKFCTKCRADRKRAEFKKNKSLWNWTM